MTFEKEYEKNERINVLPQRAYYVPFADNDEFSLYNGIVDRNKSSLFTSLNGEWFFGEHESLDDVKLDEVLTENIDVPSCVQIHGYDQIQYLNLRYPFVFNPPYVPQQNPTFHYRTTVDISDLNYCYNLVFEGVDSAFYLFVNGIKVGYSQIAHATSEFDITAYLCQGSNVIDVVVLKWCAGTYLECQDKFRFTGIFRSVYLLKRSPEHITDFKIDTDIKDSDGIVTVSNNSQVDFDCAFNGQVVKVPVGNKYSFVVKNPNLWTADTPNLYGMIITACGEKIYQQVAIRSVKIENGIFKINGKHVKLKGVNRHESNPLTGATVTVDDTLRDLKLIKSVNANAVRTSHYPDIPQFYELCNVLGIYVLDEADLETHGACCYKGNYDLALWKQFADNNLFSQAVKDRHVCLYERDKNFGCVIIWSLGNESSYGKMFYDGADYIRQHDNRPIHYEGIYNIPHDDNDYYTKRIDICSRMYASPADMLKYLSDTKETRPFLQCEYSHAMGNSNGDLSDYWQIINSDDRFMGAFVWEWCDHAVLKDGKLLYGGDSGEVDHDGNFCVDGLVTADRQLKSNTLELKACYGGKTLPDPVINKCQPLVNLPCDNPLKVTFNKFTGELTSIDVNGANILAQPMGVQFIRAFIDNDKGYRNVWDWLYQSHVEITSCTTDNNVTEFVGCVGREALKPFVHFTLKYVVYNNAVDVSLSYEQTDLCAFLPRAGISFALNSTYDKFRYFGFGPTESYVDKRLASSCSEFTSTVADNMSNNLKPQECGSHYGSSYVKFDGISVLANSPFSFSALPYSTRQLTEAKHNYDLPDPIYTWVNLDVGMSGIGTYSCGPELDVKYRLPSKGNNTFRIIFDK